MLGVNISDQCDQWIEQYQRENDCKRHEDKAEPFQIPVLGHDAAIGAIQDIKSPAPVAPEVIIPSGGLQIRVNPPGVELHSKTCEIDSQQAEELFYVCCNLQNLIYETSDSVKAIQIVISL